MGWHYRQLVLQALTVTDGSIVTPQTAFNVLVASLVAFGGFIVRLYKHKIDVLEEESAKFMTREEIAKMFEQQRADRLQMHQENLSAATQLREDVRALHGRIDQVILK